MDKWKLKKWFAVRAPKVFNDAVVGEMPGNDEKAVMGRTITVSLDQLTKNPSHAYTNALLKVIDVSGEAVTTKLVKLELLPNYIRSFVRRYRSVSDAVIPVVTRDGTNVVVKLIVITRQRAAHTKIVGVRKEMELFTNNYFKETDLDAAVTAVIEGKFQGELQAKLGHIANLNKVEVKKLEIK